MDWHFRVNQRIAEAEKSGQHRSWFVDESVGASLMVISKKTLLILYRTGLKAAKLLMRIELSMRGSAVPKVHLQRR
jgi:hypothetical protein